ncbi:MAG: hypothetical protein Q8911_01375 [Bacillota bacterium]|nr:hypothetical protein [Bacillota bacterium]
MAYSYYITPEQYEIAAKNGIRANTLNTRVRSYGWSIERAISQPIQKHYVWGELLKVANKNGIGYKTFYTRIKRGMTPQEAASIPVKTKEEVVNTMTERTRKYPKFFLDLARSNGISKDTFGYRMRRGWDPMDAATLKPMNKKEASVLADKTAFRFFKFGRGLESKAKVVAVK